jgi:tRNA U34 5-methylaminomethyl-2-thiouridine-forming methyltransferase MnmC
MNPFSFKKRLTADGSYTLFSDEMEESYHSVNGAAQESRHIFIETGLKQVKHTFIRVFEVGFGTGLNALLTWAVCKEKGIQVRYETIEAFPIDESIIPELKYDQYATNLPAQAFARLHSSSWGETIIIDPCFSLRKIQANFTDFYPEGPYDLIYMDAFAPDKQPEMWEEWLLKRLYEALSEGGILVTYCAKGEIRRRLQRCGFQMERLPGPPGKREMLRAIKPSKK